MTITEDTTTKMGIAELKKKSAFLELSYNCTFSCSFCYATWLDHPELYGRQLSGKQWLEIVDLLIKRGVEDITLTGGEPLLHPDCKDILKHLVKSRISFCLYTNGEKLDEEIMGIFKSTKGEIATSLQGVKYREKVTGSSFAFSAWERRCQNIISSGIPLYISIPVTRITLPEMKNLISRAIDIKPKNIQINPIVVEGRAKYHPELWLDYSDYQKIKTVVEMMQRKTQIPLLLSEERYCKCRGTDIVFPRGEPLVTIDKTDTPLCHRSIVVGPDGRTRQCLHTFRVTGDLSQLVEKRVKR